MMETDLHIVNPATGRQETVPLDISPYGYNSPGGLINDPRIATEHPVQLYGQQSICLCFRVWL